MNEKWSSSGSHPFLGWLIGFGSILLGIYVAILYPSGVIIKISIGFLAMLFCGWCLFAWIPKKQLPNNLRENQSGMAIIQLGITIFFYFFHPTWLSGNFWGWVSPIFPAFLIITATMAIFRILGSW